MDLGNCSIDYLTNDETGTVIIHDGHIHMHNPFFTMNIDKFAFNGVVIDKLIIGSIDILLIFLQRYSRDMDVDAYLNNHKPYHAPEGENETNVFFLSRYFFRKGRCQSSHVQLMKILRKNQFVYFKFYHTNFA